MIFVTVFSYPHQNLPCAQNVHCLEYSFAQLLLAILSQPTQPDPDVAYSRSSVVLFSAYLWIPSISHLQTSHSHHTY